MKTAVMNALKTFAFLPLGLAVAAMGIYGADADDAPGAAQAASTVSTPRHGDVADDEAR